VNGTKNNINSYKHFICYSPNLLNCKHDLAILALGRSLTTTAVRLKQGTPTVSDGPYRLTLANFVTRPNLFQSET
jgi:hypothetical protein